MFRRKEESEHDLLSDVTAAGALGSKGDHQPAESVETPSSATPGTMGYAPSSLRGGEMGKAPASPYRGAAPDLSKARMQDPRNGISAPGAAAAAIADKSAKPSRRILTVGNDILLKGEIATCDRLVIEGQVDATLNEVHTVEIAETGSFKGSAEIEDAEISGVFEGNLVVRNRLVIYSTGQVHGKITYGEIEIERGGELTGEIQTIGGASAASQKTKKAAAA